MKTILATDGSTYSKLTAELVRRIHSIAQGEIIVASVVPPTAAGFVGVEPIGAPVLASDIKEAHDFQAKHAQSAVDTVTRSLSEKGLRVRSVVLEGDPAESLMNLAEDEGAELIAVGSRGVGGLEGLLLGSVAKTLVANAPCSVFVGRCSKGEDPEKEIDHLATVEKLSVGVGVDGSDGSNVAVQAIKNQGFDSFARIVPICVEPLAVVPMGVNPVDFAQVYGADRERVQEILRNSVKTFDGYADKVEGRTQLGTPSGAMMQIAKEEQLDVIVVGATKHGFLERFLIGSVSFDLVAHAPCAVWVVRPSLAATASVVSDPSTAPT